MKSTLPDHALALFKAALNAVPLVGGSVASLLGDYVPTSRQRAVEKVAELLTEKILDIERRIDVQSIDQERFADLYGTFEALVMKTNREEKLSAAANILANAVLPLSDPNRSPSDELDHLMHCTDALSSGAIALLGASIQVRTPRHASGGDTPFYFTELRAG